MLIKQADFSACKDDLSKAPTCKKWKNLLKTMKEEQVPFSLKELAVSGNDLMKIVPATQISRILNELLLHVVIHPKENEKKRLIKLATSLNRR